MSSLRALLDWMVRSPWRAFLVLFLLSLAIRLHNMAQIPIWVFYPSPERELGAIVTSLRHTGEFADPYLLPTGPTATYRRFTHISSPWFTACSDFHGLRVT